jgi:hypothetical protein
MALILSGSGNPATVNGVDQGLTITRMTAQSFSGVSVIDFSGIPSWAQRVSVMFSSVVLSGSDNLVIRAGTSGGIVSTGYQGVLTYITTGGAGSAGGNENLTGWGLVSTAGGRGISGTLVISNITGNTWVMAGNTSYAAGTTLSDGTVTLASALTSIRIAPAGTNTLTGTINLMYE